MQVEYSSGKMGSQRASPVCGLAQIGDRQRRIAQPRFFPAFYRALAQECLSALLRNLIGGTQVAPVSCVNDPAGACGSESSLFRSQTETVRGGPSLDPFPTVGEVGAKGFQRSTRHNPNCGHNLDRSKHGVLNDPYRRPQLARVTRIRATSFARLGTPLLKG